MSGGARRERSGRTHERRHLPIPPYSTSAEMEWPRPFLLWVKLKSEVIWIHVILALKAAVESMGREEEEAGRYQTPAASLRLSCEMGSQSRPDSRATSQSDSEA